MDPISLDGCFLTKSGVLDQLKRLPSVDPDCAGLRAAQDQDSRSNFDLICTLILVQPDLIHRLLTCKLTLLRQELNDCQITLLVLGGPIGRRSVHGCVAILSAWLIHIVSQNLGIILAAKRRNIFQGCRFLVKLDNLENLDKLRLEGVSGLLNLGQKHPLG